MYELLHQQQLRGKNFTLNKIIFFSIFILPSLHFHLSEMYLCHIKEGEVSHMSLHSLFLKLEKHI